MHFHFAGDGLVGDIGNIGGPGYSDDKGKVQVMQYTISYNKTSEKNTHCK